MKISMNEIKKYCSLSRSDTKGMKVKVGDKVYSSEDQPIMVILSDKDKDNITNMLPEAHKYCEYPDDMDPKEVSKWMKEV